MNSYPQAAVDIAKRVLKFRDENPDMDCGTRVGWARANQIAKRENLSLETIKRTYSFLSRGKTYDTGSFTDPQGDYNCGSIMFAAWGGDPMLKWCKMIIEEDKFEHMKKIEINGTIGQGQGSAEYFNYIYQGIKPEEDIEIEINSLGGDFFAAVEIFSKLKKHEGKTRAVYNGLCASAATLIASACDEVVMYETGAILIHDLSQYVELIGQLKKEQIESLLGELQQNVNNLESLNKLAVKMYKRKTGKTEEEIKNLMAQDRWILSDEALSFGLVDKVIEDAQGVKAEVKIAASKQLKNNNNKLIEMDLKAKIMEIFAAEDAPKKEETQMEEESPKSEITPEVQEVFDAMNTRLEAIEAFIMELKEKMTEEEDVEIESGKGYDKEMSEKTEQIESRIENIEKRDAQIASVLDGFVTGLKQELKNQLTAQEKRIEETITALQLKENSIVTGDKTFEQKNITTAAWIDQLKQFN